MPALSYLQPCNLGASFAKLRKVVHTRPLGSARTRWGGQDGRIPEGRSRSDAGRRDPEP